MSSVQPVARVSELQASFWVVDMAIKRINMDWRWIIYVRWSSSLQMAKLYRSKKIQNLEIYPGHWGYVLVIVLICIGDFNSSLGWRKQLWYCHEVDIGHVWTTSPYLRKFFQVAYRFPDWLSLVRTLHVRRKIFRPGSGCCLGLCTKGRR